MLTERARKNPGEPIGFWKFLIVTSIVFTVLRSILTGRSPSTSGILPFAFLAYFGYRIARMQPWWPFGEDAIETPRKQDVPNPIVKRRPIREVGIANRRLPESDSTAGSRQDEANEPRVQMSGYLSESSTTMGSQVSSVGVRQKVERTKTVRSQTTERSKRR